jgi:hypothetical protein
MTGEKFKDQCSGITKEFNVHIPCRLAERAEAYASKINTEITLVIWFLKLPAASCRESSTVRNSVNLIFAR